MKNKNLKKVLSLSLCAAMAMTAVPVAGSFVNPAVVRAEEPAPTLSAATAVVQDASDVVNVTIANLTEANKGNYRYIWDSEKGKGAEKITSVTSGEALPTVNGSGEMSIPFTGVENKFLTIKKVPVKDAPEEVKEFAFTVGTVSDEVKLDEEVTKIVGFTSGDYQVRKKGEESWSTIDGTEKELGTDLDATGTATYEIRTKGKEQVLPSAVKEIVATRKIKMTDLVFSLKLSCERNLIVTPDEALKAKTLNGEVLYKKGTETGKFDYKSPKIFAGMKENDKLFLYTEGVNEESEQLSVTIGTALEIEEIAMKDPTHLNKFSQSHVYAIRKQGESFERFVASGEEHEIPGAGIYDVVKLATSGNVDGLLKKVSNSAKTAEYSLPSEVKTIRVTYPGAVSPVPSDTLSPVAPSTSTEVKPADTTKPEEPKKEETKPADTTKPEEPKKEETKPAETPTAPVIERVVNRAEAKAQIGSEAVEKIMTNGAGKVTTIIKGVAVKFDGTTLKAALGNKAEAITVSMKSGKPSKVETKAVKKYAKKNKVLVNKVYNLSVMLGEKSVNNFDLGKNTMEVVLFKKFKKAPKNLYVLNVETGKMMKAVYEEKTGKIRFNAGKAGKYVLVEKK